MALRNSFPYRIRKRYARCTEKRPIKASEALIFDVFGTVVNWRDSIIAEVSTSSRRNTGCTEGDWARFADEWRAWYGKSTRELSQR